MARDAPVSQSVLGSGLAHPRGFEPRSDALKGLVKIAPIEFCRPGQHTVLRVGAVRGLRRLTFGITDDCFHGQRILAGKLPVPLVVCRYCHDCARAVVHQHVVGDPHGNGLTGERVRGTQARIHAELLGLRHVGLGDRCLLTGGDEFSELSVVFCQRQRNRMFRGQTDIGHTVERVGPGGIDLDAIEVGHRFIQPKGQRHAAAFSNPVALHGAHGLGPAVQRVEALQQFFRIGGNANKPLRNLAALDHGTRAPAATIDHLLVGQNGLVHGIPVHRGHFFVDQAPLVELGKKPLFPLVVLWVAGGDFPVPVVGVAQSL